MIRAKQIFAFAILFVVALGIYARTVHFGLVNIDDYEYLVRSKAITGGLSAEGFAWSFKSIEHAIWMPLTWISYMVDFSLFGKECWGAMHLHSGMWHAVNTVLLGILLIMILHRGEIEHGRSFSVAILLAGFWAFHPLRVESVAWLSSRKDVLSFTFELLAFLCWMSGTRHRIDDWRFHAKYLLSILFFGMGAMSKPSVMTFPILQACIDIFICRKIRPWMYILPGLMMPLIGIEASMVQSAGGATGDLGDVPLFARILNAASAFGIYVTNTIIPTELAPQCMNRYPALPKNLLAGIMLSIVSAVYLVRKCWLFWARRRELFLHTDENSDPSLQYVGRTEWFFTGIVWFVVGIGPFLGIANFGYHAYADRFTYIPAVGLSIALLPVVLTFRRKVWIVVALLTILCVLTWRQIGIWKDDSTVWQQTIKVDGDKNVVAHGGLGLVAFEIDHDLETCCRELSLVKELNEGAYWNFVQVHVFALCESGRLNEAEAVLGWYRKAMSTYSEQNKRTEKTLFGVREVSTRLNNLDYAEIAYEICTETNAQTIAARLSRLIIETGKTPSTAYLLYRLGQVTSNEKLKEHALNELSKVVKTDFLQFRYLTKENEI